MSKETHPPRRIFISYDNTFLSRQGWEAADRLRSELRAAGFDVLMDDEKADPGRPYPKDAIKEAVNRSDAMLAFLGSGSSQPDLRREEHQWAIDSGMPLLIVNASNSPRLPVHLSGRPWRRYPDELTLLLADLKLDPPRVYRGPREPNYDTIPRLPPHFLPRESALSALRDLVLIRGTGRVIGISGSPGSGKTVLLAALCEDDSVRQAFPDAVGWIIVGREWNGRHSTLKAEIASAIGEDVSGGYGRISNEYHRACDAGYATVMASTRSLVVIDDVSSLEQVKPLLTQAPHTCFVVTTRDPVIARALTDLTFEVDPLNLSEARKLLELCSGRMDSSLSSEAEAILSASAGLPGSLAQVGASLRDAGPRDWQNAAESLTKGTRSDFESIRIGVASLPPLIRERYLKLAVLLEDMVAPVVVLQTLWQTSAEETRRTAKLLVARALASAVEPSGGIRLHDIQLDYARSCFPDRHALEMILWAVRASAATLAIRPEEFCSQITGRLLSYRGIPSIGALIDGIRSGVPHPWAEPLWPSLRAPASTVILSLAIPARGVYLTPDGRRAIAPCDLQRFTVWDLQTGTELYRTPEPANTSCEAVKAADDHRVFAALQDGTITVWDIHTKQHLYNLNGHRQFVIRIELIHDGRRAVSASLDGTLKLWDLDAGKEIRTLSGHQNHLFNLVATPDGRIAISSAFGGGTKIWDLETGQELRSLTRPDSCAGSCLAVTPDSRFAFSAQILGELVMWEIASGRKVRTFQGHRSKVNDVAVTGDGLYAISVCSDGQLNMWNLETGVCTRSLNANSGQALQVAVTPDGRRAAVWYVDQTVKVWNLAGEEQPADLRVHTNFVSAVHLMPDRRRVASASWDGAAKILDLESGNTLAVLKGHKLVTDMAVTADGRVITVGTDREAKVWDPHLAHVLTTFTGHTDQILAVAVSADGRAVTSSRDGTLKLWEINTGREMLSMPGPASWSQSVALTPDGRCAVAICDAGTLGAWNLENGRQLFRWQCQGPTIAKVVVTADGRFILSASTDGTVRTLDLARREIVQTLQLPDDIRALAVSPDGRLVASGSQQYGIKIWDLAEGVVLAGFTCEGGPLSCAFTAPDELLVGDTSGRVYRLRLVRPS